MIRRAQGMFYEASSFGNLSAFFLSLTLAILLSWWKQLSVAWKATLYLMIGIFTTALFLSYSRGSWANVLVTVTVFLILQRKLRVTDRGSFGLCRGGFCVSGLSDVAPRGAQFLQLENGNSPGVLERSESGDQRPMGGLVAFDLRSSPIIRGI